MRGTFTTTITWEDANGEEVEASVRVLYSATNGYAATYDEPGCEGEMEIITIISADPTLRIPEHFYDQEELVNECWSDWEAEQEYAREWRAQSRRDEALMNRINGRPA